MLDEGEVFCFFRFFREEYSNCLNNIIYLILKRYIRVICEYMGSYKRRKLKKYMLFVL